MDLRHHRVVRLASSVRDFVNPQTIYGQCAWCGHDMWLQSARRVKAIDFNKIIIRLYSGELQNLIEVAMPSRGFDVVKYESHYFLPDVSRVTFRIL